MRGYVSKDRRRSIARRRREPSPVRFRRRLRYAENQRASFYALSLAGAEAGTVGSSNARVGCEPRPSVFLRIETLDEQHLVRFHVREVEPVVAGAEPDHVNFVLQISWHQVLLRDAS